MLNENAQKWVDGLRSGKYTQGAEFLTTWRGDDCCLGVACKLFIAEHPDELWTDTHPDLGCVEYIDPRSSEVSTLFLPTIVQTWLELRDEGGSYAGTESLTRDNDNGRTFEEIAAIIEAEPKGLFI